MQNDNAKFKNAGNDGFTLVEMLVTVAVFSLIVGTSTGIFVSALKIQRYNLATQELFNQTGYALEYMDRFLRMAKKDIVGNCIPEKTNYQNPIEAGQPNTSKIRFLNYNGECQEFFRDGVPGNYVLKVKQKIATVQESTLPLISDKFNVTSLKFQIDGAQQPPADYQQPRVTIFMEIEARSSLQPKPKLTVQTTISQRALDLEE